MGRQDICGNLPVPLLLVYILVEKVDFIVDCVLMLTDATNVAVWYNQILWFSFIYIFVSGDSRKEEC